MASPRAASPSVMKLGMDHGSGCSATDFTHAEQKLGLLPDQFNHEIATAFNLKDRGLIILTSCSHRGVVNAVRQAQEVSGFKKVHAIIGGLHLAPYPPEYLAQTLSALKEIDPDYLVPLHCSGEPFFELAKRELGPKVIRGYTVGGSTSIEPGTLQRASSLGEASSGYRAVVHPWPCPSPIRNSSCGSRCIPTSIGSLRHQANRKSNRRSTSNRGDAVLLESVWWSAPAREEQARSSRRAQERRLGPIRLHTDSEICDNQSCKERFEGIVFPFAHSSPNGFYEEEARAK
jgi:hypothetical protein